MSDLFLVLTTEFARKIRSRIFLIATLGGAVGIAALVLAPILFAGLSKTQTNALVLAGPAPLRARAAAALRADFAIVASVDALPAVVDRAYLDAHHAAAAAVRLQERNRRLHLDVYARDLAAFDQVQFRALVPLNVELATGLPSARVAALTRVDRALHGIDAKFVSATAASAGHAFALGLIFLLYFAIVLASQTVMSAVAEEKTSRIAEILVATIDPVDLLTGKTLAAAALAVVQIAVWGIAALVALPFTALALGGAAEHSARGAGLGGGAPPGLAGGLGALDPWSLAAFAVFFALGYLQYATLYAAAASLVSRTEDLGAVTTPIILPAVVAFLFAQYAIVSPDAGVVALAGFVPLVSPFVMFARIAVASVPAWQIALALALNLATVVVAFVIAGKVYRVGMLITGRLPSARQIWTTLRSGSDRPRKRATRCRRR